MVVVVVRTSVNYVICRYFLSFRYWVDLLVLINIIIIIVHVNRNNHTANHYSESEDIVSNVTTIFYYFSFL